jgi:hypothetical protein
MKKPAQPPRPTDNPTPPVVNSNPVRINWEYSGFPDLGVGTGATGGEKFLGYGTGFFAFIFYILFYLSGTLSWGVWQYLLAIFLAFDVMGGVVANSLNSCKRFYHTPPKADEGWIVRFVKNPHLFAAIHVHTIVVGVAFDNFNWFYGLFWYLLLLIATEVVLLLPLYLQRPVAMLFILGALLTNIYLITPVVGFEWLAPALFLKIVYGHVVREEPYRPIDPPQPSA